MADIILNIISINQCIKENIERCVVKYEIRVENIGVDT